jgi:competence protein ComFC
MRCMICEALSPRHICTSCKEKFLTPSIYKRSLSNGVTVISFYKYKEIKDLIHTKHTDVGYYIYSILADIAFKKFAEAFVFDTVVAGIGVDDRAKRGYSHTAILNKALKSRYITPLFTKLRSTNDTIYSAKSYEQRAQNPRDFRYKHFAQTDVILVDDIITTGLTLTQAHTVLSAQGKNVLFCLTLADAQD